MANVDALTDLQNHVEAIIHSGTAKTIQLRPLRTGKVWDITVTFQLSHEAYLEAIGANIPVGRSKSSSASRKPSEARKQPEGAYRRKEGTPAGPRGRKAECDEPAEEPESPTVRSSEAEEGTSTGSNKDEESEVEEEPSTGRSKKEKVVLTEEQERVYERLVRLRREIARRWDRNCTHIAPDKTLRIIARDSPKTEKALEGVAGINERRRGLIGAAVMAVLKGKELSAALDLCLTKAEYEKTKPAQEGTPLSKDWLPKEGTIRYYRVHKIRPPPTSKLWQWCKVNDYKVEDVVSGKVQVPHATKP
jgi:hypothetical protein